MTRIPGPSLCGFADFFAEHGHELGPEGGVTIGAAPKRGRVAAKKTLPAGRGKVPVKRAAAGQNKSPHKAALLFATSAGKRALDFAKKGKAKVAAYKPAQHGPIVPIAATRVTGWGTVVLGAAPAAQKAMTPKQQTAVKRHTQAIANHLAATRRLAAASLRAEKAGNDALAFVKTAAPFLKKALTNPAKVHILGGDASGLNPGDPGYDPTTDPSSPQYAGPPTDGGGQDTSTSASGVVTAPDGTVLYDPSTDPMLIPMPQRGGTLSQSDADMQHGSVPDDGIPYDGSIGFPDRSVGSYNVFYGPPGAQNGYAWHGDNKWWLEQGQGNFDQQNPGPPNYGNDLGLGPLIGNPNGPLANMQWATMDAKWFWQSANAPAHFTNDIDNKITEANNKTIAANTAAAQVQAAQMAKDAADAAEAQAKQDAANALAESAAQTQADIAAQAQQAQQGQLDIQQQQADIEAQKQQAQVQAEAQHALIEQSQIWNEWAKAHPDEAMAQMAEEMDQGGGEDAGDGSDQGDEGDDTGGDDQGDDQGDGGEDVMGHRYTFDPGFGDGNQ